MMLKRIKKKLIILIDLKNIALTSTAQIKQSALVRFQQRDMSVVLVFLKLYVQDISWCCQTLI